MPGTWVTTRLRAERGGAGWLAGMVDLIVVPSVVALAGMVDLETYCFRYASNGAEADTGRTMLRWLRAGCGRVMAHTVPLTRARPLSGAG
jgi:hypothetical protein